jgi:hypothetical protein
MRNIHLHRTGGNPNLWRWRYLRRIAGNISMTTLTVFSPIKVAVPRAARWTAQVFAGLLSGLTRAAEARAEREVQAARAAEASAVREYAQRFAGHDPRFTADLLAAADRHEMAK